MDPFIFINIGLFLALMAIFYWMQKKYFSFTTRVLSALGAGIILGFIIKYISSTEALSQTLEYYNVIGSGYIGLLQMMIFPLVIVSILKAMIKIEGNQGVGKVTGGIIAILVGITVISALVGAVVATQFNLNASDIIGTDETQARGMKILELQEKNEGSLSVTQTILSFIPRNPFLDMTGARPSSLIAVVIFTLFLGTAFLEMRRKKPEAVKSFEDLVNSFQVIISRMLTKVLRLTPYGVLALIASATATNDVQQTIALGRFILATYVALTIVFIIHLILISLTGLNPITYIKKAFPLLLFAFTSRSSMASVPINIETQEKKMGNSAPIANLSASFGSVVGQSGCAGVYPAMLAVMIATSNGVNPLSLSFLLPLLGIVAITSFGVAGVGGGATFAALMVLPALGLDVTLAGLLIAVEPLLDMGRTALNVNGAATAGLLVGRQTNQLNKDIFNDMSIQDDSEKGEDL